MLKKYISCLLMFFWANVCMAHDINYYTMNPKEMQNALTACPAHHPNDVSCEQLNHIAMHMNDLAMELRQNPQGYGQSILAMQENIAKQRALNAQHETTPELQAELVKNQQVLRDRLTIIKWLESPDVR